ncbi:MAG: transporter ATP-binding protein [Bacteroidetes bacterium]|nr:transporter ATP-binding protein [Bacteroidota bacterium]
MKIDLDKVSKKYGSQWIFRGVSASFESGGIYAITGANGSGKSTLLKIVSGIITPNEGKVTYAANSAAIPVEDIYKYLSYSAPYLDLPEELTIAEMIAFHAGMKSLHGITATELLKVIDIPAGKEIRDCSSGMKQRVKFALAYYTQSDILLLDEPTANMDHHWRDWTLSLVRADAQKRIIIICSNEEYEYDFAQVLVSL